MAATPFAMAPVILEAAPAMPPGAETEGVMSCDEGTDRKSHVTGVDAALTHSPAHQCLHSQSHSLHKLLWTLDSTLGNTTAQHHSNSLSFSRYHSVYQRPCSLYLVRLIEEGLHPLREPPD